MNPIHRRKFLQTTGSAVALPILANAPAAAASQRVSLLLDSLPEGPGRWAADQLRRTLEARGIAVQVCQKLAEVPAGHLCIVAAGAGSGIAQEVLRGANIRVPSTPESLAIALGNIGGKSMLAAYGHDARGVVYALLELSDRAENGADAVAALTAPRGLAEQPANQIRSVSRAFVSDVEDKSWFNDRAMWPEYLTMLAAQRFNRFNLCLSLGYDFMRQVTDAYFLFPYPFLFSVPGYKVRATNLPDTERDNNLAMLRFISEETVKRGLDFQLGLWTHTYEWIDTKNANHYIEGLTPQNHAAYCRDALALLLKECPAITGLTIRIHGESGVPEGNYDFWRTLFGAIATCGRRVEIDMHAKGMDQEMIDVALETRQPVVLSPKYWAEHFGMPYHQAAIRELEMVHPDRQPGHGALMKISAGTRSFLRYGYGDLMKEDRQYKIIFRMFPGALRHLLWGDPQIASGYGRVTSFCGSDGIELHEPLFFKGRRGSGLPGGRNAYADASLNPKWDWQKFLYYYRVWGRNLYSPTTEPEVWQRYLRKEFRSAAPAAEAALANASRIIPTFTTSHGASAAHNSYWIEMYVNMSLTDPKRHHYRDTPEPRVFGNVSPFDPQLFSTMNDFAREMLSENRTGKYSPVDVATWLEEYSAAGAKHLADAQKLGPQTPEFRRFAIDTGIQIGLGQFWAAKLRAGVLYGIYEQTGDRAALQETIRMYRAARDAWSEFATPLKTVYRADIAYGGEKFLRGHWFDRLAAIDDDISEVSAKLDQTKAGEPSGRVRAAVTEALRRSKRPNVSGRHAPPARFQPGQPLPIEAAFEKASSVRLYYRHVDQAERYESAEMQGRDNVFRAEIPAVYTQTDYPLEYYFEVHYPGNAAIFPGLGADLMQQPYFAVRRA